MLTFGHFLREEYLMERGPAKPAAPVGNVNDDKGKAHEIELARALGSHLAPEGQEYSPSHFRPEEKYDTKKNDFVGGTPDQVSKRIYARQGPEFQSTVRRHAGQTSDAIIDHLIKTGAITSKNDIQGVHWTSNADTAKKPGDHERLTGIKDPNQKADLIVTAKHPKTGQVIHIPISAKYGSNEEPNYANWGHDQTGREAGMPVNPKTGTNALEDLRDRQNAVLQSDPELSKFHGGKSAAERHEKFKVDRDVKETHDKNLSKYNQELSAYTKLKNAADRKKEKFTQKPPKEPKLTAAQQKQYDRAHKAQQISIDHRQKMSQVFADAMNQRTKNEGHDGSVRQFIQNAISRPTVFPTIIAHSKTDKNDPTGEADSRVFAEHDLAPSILNKYKNLEAQSGGADSEGSVATHFYGINKSTGQREKIATQLFKASSGPYKGSNGTFTLNNSQKALSAGDPEPAPENNLHADSHTGAPVETTHDVPENATVVSPKAQRVQRQRTAIQRMAAKAGLTKQVSPIEATTNPRIASNDYKEHASGDIGGISFNDQGQ